MRTIKFVKDQDKAYSAKETMEIYAPLADRMGMNRIRDELEDLSFCSKQIARVLELKGFSILKIIEMILSNLFHLN